MNLCTMSKPVTLKIKSKSGQWIVKHMTDEDKFDDLRLHISTLTGIPWKCIEVLGGFPPQLVLPDSGNWSLAKSGIRSGDTLIVQEGAASTKVEEDDQPVLPAKKPKAPTVAPSHNRGILMKKVVPSDNSCLFTSFNYCLYGEYDKSSTQQLRKLIAAIISSEPDKYDKAMLQQSNADYCRWIQKEASWGGAIELAILSDQYSVEICVVDTKAGNVKRFGEDKNFLKRIFLMYDSIHYDALYLEPIDPMEKLQTVFPVEEDDVLLQAQEIAAEAQSAAEYTDTSSFSLECGQCSIKLRGANEANEHAQKTGHVSFRQIR